MRSSHGTLAPLALVLDLGDSLAAPQTRVVDPIDTGNFATLAADRGRDERRHADPA